MVNATEGGGGGDVTGRVDGLVSEIEGLIGQLRGVEDSWHQLIAPIEAWEQQQADTPSPVTAEPVWRTFHIRGDHGFSVEQLVPGGEAASSGRTDPAGDRIQSAMDAAFESARNSGHGALEFSRYVLTQVVDPDHGALLSSALAVEEVALWLEGFTNAAVPDFVETLRASWPATSLGSKTFYEFYELLAHNCTQYYLAAARLAGITAGVSTLVRHYQQTLVSVLESGRDQLIKALETWQSFKGPQQLVSIQRSGGADNAAAGFGGLSLLTGIVGLIPGVGLAAGGVSAIAGLASYAVGDDDIETRIDTVSTVVDITSSLNESLVGLRREMGEALDKLGDGGPGFESFDTYVAESQVNPLWEAKKVDLG